MKIPKSPRKTFLLLLLFPTYVAFATVAPMGRWSVIIFVVIVLPLGFASGFFLRQFLQQDVTISEQDQTQTVSAGATNLQGWCCPEKGKGNVCAQTESSIVCLRGGGRLFHGEQEKCNKACAFTAS